jgi:hypothetical protein
MYSVWIYMYKLQKTSIQYKNFLWSEKTPRSFLHTLTVLPSVVSYSCNRPWRPIGLWDVEAPILSRPSISNFKEVVIDFLVSKLPVIYHPLLTSYLALSKTIGKDNTTHDVCCTCKSNLHWKYRLTLFVKNRKIVIFPFKICIIILYYKWIYTLFTYNFLIGIWDRPKIVPSSTGRSRSTRWTCLV